MVSIIEVCSYIYMISSVDNANNISRDDGSPNEGRTEGLLVRAPVMAQPVATRSLHSDANVNEPPTIITDDNTPMSDAMVLDECEQGFR